MANLRSSPRYIAQKDIKSGMILDFGYNKLNGESKMYQALVIDPSKSDEHTGNLQLHGLLIDDLDDQKLLEMLKMLGSFFEAPPGWRNPIADYNSDEVYERIKQRITDSKKRYRTFLVDNITRPQQRIVIFEQDYETKKVKVGQSVLYGVDHGKYVFINSKDFHKLASELKRVDYSTYYEGPSHEEPTKKLLELFDPDKKYLAKAESWEPPLEDFSGMAEIGLVLAGWWNQTIDDGTGLPNIKSVWGKTGLSLDGTTIGEAFRKSVGSHYQTIINNFTDYSAYGRYSKNEFMLTLDEVGFDSAGNSTDALKKFNEAGHDQVFPEDAEGFNLPPGKLHATQASLNRARDLHLIKLMKNNPGIYFAGYSHVDLVKEILGTS
jgi:hypothetical protein